MASTVGDLLNKHPSNPVHDTGYYSSTNKAWAQQYPPITRVNVRTSYNNDEVGTAVFDNGAFLPQYEDDNARFLAPASAPNDRHFRLDTEEDGAVWFHTEISNVVLPAWYTTPKIVQASHEKALKDSPDSQVVDVAYSIKMGTTKAHVALGEFKRGLIRAPMWQSGRIDTTQDKLGRELRGYADKYSCPHIFCFDHHWTIFLQFRAGNRDDIRDAKCEIDCWVLPRVNPGGTTLRYMFYRFLAQGFRRCQGLLPVNAPIYGMLPQRREFFTGRPLYKIEGKLYFRPLGCIRKVDGSCGAFRWTYENGTDVVDNDGNFVWETSPTW